MSTTPQPTEPMLSLHEVADRLGLHYMTIYRWVRTGRLPAVKHGGEWRVRVEDLEHSGMDPSTPVGTPSGTVARRRGRSWQTLLANRLVAADEPGAWQVLQDALAAGATPEDLYLDVIGQALHRIGVDWSAGRVDVSEEHAASAITNRLLGRLGPLFSKRGRRRGTVVLGAPPGDLHGIPVTLVADPLRGRGFDVIDLGPDVPAASWAHVTGRATSLVAVGICATRPDTDDAIAAAVRSVHGATDRPVVLGGAAVHDRAHADRLGADRWSSSGRSVIETMESIAAQR